MFRKPFKSVRFIPRDSWSRLLRILILAGGLAFSQSAPGTEALTVESLTTNGRNNPLGIAADDVSFGWAMNSDQRGVVQSAWQIRVRTAEGDASVWNPEVARSDRQGDIRLPEGVKLAPATRYLWQVKVWDGRGVEGGWSAPAWFETGLLSEADWAGAEWISRPVENLTCRRCHCCAA